MQLSRSSFFVSVSKVLENRIVYRLDTKYDKNIHGYNHNFSWTGILDIKERVIFVVKFKFTLVE
jgi:hypothetical protein